MLIVPIELWVYLLNAKRNCTMRSDSPKGSIFGLILVEVMRLSLEEAKLPKLDVI